MVASWSDHLRQLNRLVASDRDVEDRILALTTVEPETHYAFRVEVGATQ